MFNYVQSSSIMFNHFQSSSIIFNHFPSCSIIFHHVQSFSIIFHHVQSSSIMFNHFQSSSIIFNHFPSCSIIFNHVQSCSHLKMKQNPIKHDKSRICHSSWAVLHHLHLPTPWRPPRGRLLGPSRRSRKPGGSASDLPKKLQKYRGCRGAAQNLEKCQFWLAQMGSLPYKYDGYPVCNSIFL